MDEGHRNGATHVDKKTAKGKGEGGFNPHPDDKNPDHKDGYQGESRADDEARRVTPAGKARSK